MIGPSLPGPGIPGLIEHCGHRYGPSPAVIYRDETVSYRELAARTELLAAGLRRIGFRRGERCAIFLEKRLETVTSMLAVSSCGGIFVPVNPLLKPQQVAHIVRDSGASLLVTSASRLTAIASALRDLPELCSIVVVDAETSPPAPTRDVEVITWDHVAELGREAEPVDAPPITESDLAAILYTSGSTGSPKGVVLSHGNLLAGARSVASYLHHTRDDVLLAVLPLSFDAGLSQLTTAWVSGAHTVLLNYLLPRDVARACERFGVTALTGVPPLWGQLVGIDWPPRARSGLRYVASTGGRMPRGVLDRLRALFPQAKPYLMYGLTEAFRSTYLEPDLVDSHPHSIGRAIPNAEVLVLQPDGRPCAPGQPGELVHRGPLVAQGYWRDPERTAQRFRPLGEGAEWRGVRDIAVWSGDTVFADEDGLLHFVDRRDAMIKTSGYRVSPTEIEDAAHDTGLVSDAVAFGVPDPDLGERIVLVVSTSEQVTVADLELQLRQRLPGFMVPKQIERRDDLPRTPNGKYDRARLTAEVTS